MKRLHAPERSIYLVTAPVMVVVSVVLVWLLPTTPAIRFFILMMLAGGVAYAGVGYWLRTRKNWSGLRYTTPLVVISLITAGLFLTANESPLGFLLYFPAVIVTSIRSGRTIGLGAAVLATLGYFVSIGRFHPLWPTAISEVVFIGSNLFVVGVMSGAIVDEERNLRRIAQERRVNEQSALLKLADALAVGELDLPGTLAAAAQTAAHVLRADAVAIMRATDSAQYQMQIGWGLLAPYTGQQWPIEATSLAARAIQELNPVAVGDYHVEKHMRRWTPEEEQQVRAGLAVPILRAGQAQGVFLIYSSTPHDFTEDDQHLLTLIANQTLIAVERHQAEAELRASEEQYRHLFDNNPMPMWVYDSETLAFLHVNEAACEHYGYTHAEFLALTLKDIRPPEDVATLEINLNQGRHKPKRFGQWRHCKKDGTLMEVEITSHEISFAGRRARLVLANDVTERNAAEAAEYEQRTLAEALRDTAAALNRTLDLDEVLDNVLRNVGHVVPHDSANVMLLNSGVAHVVRRHGEADFVPVAVMERRLALEATPTLRHLAETGQPIVIADTHHDLRWVDLTESHWVRSYVGAPIRFHGEVLGCLNLNSVTPGFFTDQYAERLQVFADQAGLAIQNARLFADLQNSHAELAQAYDATLEGWSRALDLRDRETEGHTRRVTEITIRLAEKMGLSPEDQIQIRRGALLHDIGKMGIPDAILLKPGQLTDDEWQIMRRHPQYAYDMLAPIAFLRAALDIPYAHHERWDGTGYPRGLRGEAIPLSARLFTVVDVWDALRSNRPYRNSWPEESVRSYIRERTGSQFDPHVVQAFLEMFSDS